MDRFTGAWWYVPIIGALGTLARIVYIRFKKSGSAEFESYLRYVGNGIRYYIGRPLKRGLASEFTLRQYARARLQTSKKTMFVPGRPPVNLDIDTVFIPLLLAGGGSARVRYTELIADRGRRLAILGEPGSGKSSLLRRSFRDACRRAATSPRKAQAPVIYDLKDLVREGTGGKLDLSGEALFNVLTAQISSQAVYQPKGAVRDLQAGSGLLLLLDGLDEVPSDKVDSVMSALVDLSHYVSKASPASTIAFTSRSQFYAAKRRRDLDEEYTTLEIKPFKTADIFIFLTRWPFHESARTEIARIFSRIRRLPSLLETCRNPLALAMFVARDQTMGGTESPETRTEFYRDLVAELISNRRFRGDGELVGRQRLQTDRSSALGKVCLSHLLDASEGANSIPSRRLENAVDNLVQPSKENIQSAVIELGNVTGLYSVERDGETYRFHHLTLCEYLAAYEVVQGGESTWSTVCSRLRDPDSMELWQARLGEIVVFASALAPRSLLERIVDDLLSLQDIELLMRCALEAPLFNQEDAIDAVREEILRLSGEPESIDRERLRLVLQVLRTAQMDLQPRHAKKLPPPGEFLSELVKLELTAVNSSVVTELAYEDPDTALSVVEDLSNHKLLTAVLAATEDAAVLQAVIARCEAGSSTWKRALLHRALYDTQLAEILARTPSTARTSGEAGHEWGNWWLLRNSMYAQLLSEANDPTLGSDLLHGESSLILDEVIRVRLPRVAWFDKIRFDERMGWLSPIVIAAMQLLYLTYFYIAYDGEGFPFVSATSLVAFCLGIVFVIRRRARKRNARAERRRWVEKQLAESDGKGGAIERTLLALIAESRDSDLDFVRAPLTRSRLCIELINVRHYVFLSLSPIVRWRALLSNSDLAALEKVRQERKLLNDRSLHGTVGTTLTDAND